MPHCVFPALFLKKRNGEAVGRRWRSAHRLSKLHPPAGLLALRGEQWPGLGRIPACLSCWPQFFHAVIKPADNAELGALFSQDPQHTATHSDGVTQTSTTEPPLSEAAHTARPRPAAGSHIGLGLCQFDCYH